MEKPIVGQLIRRGQLSDPWVQSGHKWYMWGKDHGIAILWAILMVLALWGTWVIAGIIYRGWP